MQIVEQHIIKAVEFISRMVIRLHVSSSISAITTLRHSIAQSRVHTINST